MATYDLRITSEIGELEITAEGKSPKNAVYECVEKLEAEGLVSIPADVEWKGPNGSGTMHLVLRTSKSGPSRKDMPIEIWLRGWHKDTGKEIRGTKTWPPHDDPNELWENEILPFLLERGFVGPLRMRRKGPRDGWHHLADREVTLEDYN